MMANYSCRFLNGCCFSFSEYLVTDRIDSQLVIRVVPPISPGKTCLIQSIWSYPKTVRCSEVLARRKVEFGRMGYSSLLTHGTLNSFPVICGTGYESFTPCPDVDSRLNVDFSVEKICPDVSSCQNNMNGFKLDFATLDIKVPTKPLNVFHLPTLVEFNVLLCKLFLATLPKTYSDEAKEYFWDLENLDEQTVGSAFHYMWGGFEYRFRKVVFLLLTLADSLVKHGLLAKVLGFWKDQKVGVFWKKLNTLENLRQIQFLFPYVMFLFLVYLHPNIKIVPTPTVDEVWHYHILDTTKYKSDCQRLFGRFLHHFPYFSLGKENDRKDLDRVFAESLSFHHFGSDIFLDGNSSK